MKYKKNLNSLYNIVGYDSSQPKPEKISEFCVRATRKYLDINIQLMYMGTGTLQGDLENYTRLIVLQTKKKNLVVEKESCWVYNDPDFNFMKDLERILTFTDGLMKVHTLYKENVHINEQSVYDIQLKYKGLKAKFPDS